MVNEVYLHLLAQREHHEACTERRCHSACEIARLEQWLAAPILSSDVEAAELADERLKALMRGDLPA